MTSSIRIDRLDGQTIGLHAPPHPLLNGLLGAVAEPALSHRHGRWILPRSAELAARRILRDLFGSNGDADEAVVAVVVRFSRGVSVPGLPYLFGRRLLGRDGDRLTDSEGVSLLDGAPCRGPSRRWRTVLPPGTAFYMFDLPARAPELAVANQSLRAARDFEPIPADAIDIISRSPGSSPSLARQAQYQPDGVVRPRTPVEPRLPADEAARRLVEVARRLDLSPAAYQAAVHAAARVYQSAYWVVGPRSP